MRSGLATRKEKIVCMSCSSLSWSKFIFGSWQAKKSKSTVKTILLPEVIASCLAFSRN